MSKRTVFTTLTPLPAGISRETVLETLHDHLEMIDLNPLVEERHLIKPPPKSTAEEYHCQWYSLTDRVSYLPGGLASGKVTYTACFHDLPVGLQTHVYAPMGLNIKNKWSLGGSLPGEAVAPVEMGVGAPLQGLWIREDVDMKCNIMMTSFVKKTLKKAHAALVDRLSIKAQIVDAALKNQELNNTVPSHASLRASTRCAPSTSDFDSQSHYAASPPTFNPYPHSPPPQSEHPAFRDRTTETTMTFRSTQDHLAPAAPPHLARTADRRIKITRWETKTQAPGFPYLKASPYHHRDSFSQLSSEGSPHHVQGRRESGRQDQKSMFGYPGPPPPPKPYGAVELE
ncbi:hypothetical protein LHYA1_G001479 [Lachnellula hyalina]|uniref:DUF7053 domain-containing protein n=1 Tax=Lachnellula hyalina TaxID=1316788 RepID=A0A8H8R6K2_9HELO|nr:uncharacterized protein LHYA1_G001479 [Lachnellula hyalina]TVY29523.1 hypothetical protein LHYA1_G001479 [Lachnellula hyalina]